MALGIVSVQAKDIIINHCRLRAAALSHAGRICQCQGDNALLCGVYDKEKGVTPQVKVVAMHLCVHLGHLVVRGLPEQPGPGLRPGLRPRCCLPSRTGNASAAAAAESASARPAAQNGAHLHMPLLYPGRRPC